MGDSSLQSNETGDLRARAEQAEALAAAMGAEVDRLRGMAGHSSPDSTQLHLLVRDLRWPGGPRSIRAVLPLARVLRAISWQHQRPTFGDAAASLTQGPRRPLWKRAGMRAYRLVRPVVLPIAVRCHRGLGWFLHHESAAVRGQVAAPSAPSDMAAEMARSFESALLTLALQARAKDEGAIPPKQ